MAFSVISPSHRLHNHNKLFSPKLDVVTRDWNKDDFTLQSVNSDNTTTFSLRQRDRFMPTILKPAAKIVIGESSGYPLPSESPSVHLNAQNSIIYKESVASACGIDLNSRIMSFQQGLERVPSSASSNNSTASIQKLTAVKSRSRRIPTTLEKVLDAPSFCDDFYLNLLSWSCDQLIAIALEDTVYVWNSNTGAVDSLPLCDRQITSVSWSEDGSYLSLGKQDGTVEIWDMESMTRLRTMKNIGSRVGVHRWKDHLITSGSRSGKIHHHDVRLSKHIVTTMNSHTAEVCGLEWRDDGLKFCSGGNDNVVNIYDSRSTTPQFTKTTHTALVKAIAWCPTQNSLLATGGGSADRHIHFWNTTTGTKLNSVDTGSQISSLSWGYANGIGREICATHGFPDNSISVWSYPTLQKTGAILNAHDSRILQSTLSPDGVTLATVAADESLKFWKIFDVQKSKSNNVSSTIESLLTVR